MDNHGVNISLQGHITPSSVVMHSPPTGFALRLLDNFSISTDKEALVNNCDFLNGTLVPSMADDPTEEEKGQYYLHCLKTLDWSFSEKVMRSSEMALFFASVMEDMEEHVREIVNSLGSLDHEAARAKLFLDNTPFRCARRLLSSSIQELPKDDEVRVACQALFLFILRPFIPLKYENLEDFLERYPEFKERGNTEQNRLRHTANWMDLAFYTIQPRNNKTFILNLIPRITEGRSARYITGSGQTKPTTDRVNLFRLEGNCEKIKRPPRRKKDEASAPSTVDKSSSTSANGNGKSASKGNVPAPRLPAPMPMMAGLPGAVPHPSMMAYPAMYMPNGSGWIHYQPMIPNGLPPGYAMPSHQTPFASESDAASAVVAASAGAGAQPLQASYFPPGFWPAGGIPPAAMAVHSGQAKGEVGGTGANEDGIPAGAFYPACYPRMLVHPYLPAASVMPSHPTAGSGMTAPSSMSFSSTHPSSVLGKRAAEGEHHQGSEDSRACGLNLLFAAVNSLEANFS